MQEFAGFEHAGRVTAGLEHVTGQPGARKPVVSELFTCLAEAAVERGARYFGFTNSDILFTPAAIEPLQPGDRTAYVFGRDLLTLRAERNATSARSLTAPMPSSWRRRGGCRTVEGFGGYVVGDGCWDNVYSAQLLCWAGGLLLNREPLYATRLTPSRGGKARLRNTMAILRRSTGCTSPAGRLTRTD